jgi:hypothetical protein
MLTPNPTDANFRSLLNLHTPFAGGKMRGKKFSTPDDYFYL